MTVKLDRDVLPAALRRLADDLESGQVIAASFEASPAGTARLSVVYSVGAKMPPLPGIEDEDDDPTVSIRGPSGS